MDRDVVDEIGARVRPNLEGRVQLELLARELHVDLLAVLQDPLDVSDVDEHRGVGAIRGAEVREAGGVFPREFGQVNRPVVDVVGDPSLALVFVIEFVRLVRFRLVLSGAVFGGVSSSVFPGGGRVVVGLIPFIFGRIHLIVCVLGPLLLEPDLLDGDVQVFEVLDCGRFVADVEGDGAGRLVDGIIGRLECGI